MSVCVFADVEHLRYQRAPGEGGGVLSEPQPVVGGAGGDRQDEAADSAPSGVRRGCQECQELRLFQLQRQSHRLCQGKG